MKILISFFFVLMTWQKGNTQNVPVDSVKYELNKKSKTQRTIGIVLLSAGAVTTLIGTSVGVGHVWTDIFEGKKQVSGTGAMIAGITMMAGSIPFFIMAGNNHRASLVISNIPQLQMNTGLVSIRSTAQLSLTLTKQIF